MLKKRGTVALEEILFRLFDLLILAVSIGILLHIVNSAFSNPIVVNTAIAADIAGLAEIGLGAPGSLTLAYPAFLSNSTAKIYVSIEPGKNAEIRLPPAAAPATFESPLTIRYPFHNNAYRTFSLEDITGDWMIVEQTDAKFHFGVNPSLKMPQPFFRKAPIVQQPTNHVFFATDASAKFLPEPAASLEQITESFNADLILAVTTLPFPIISRLPPVWRCVKFNLMVYY